MQGPKWKKVKMQGLKVHLHLNYIKGDEDSIRLKKKQRNHEVFTICLLVNRPRLYPFLLFEYQIWFQKNISLLYLLYHTILQHTLYLNFYFPIQLNKIIYLHNKIIYNTLKKRFRRERVNKYFCVYNLATVVSKFKRVLQQDCKKI